MNKMQALWIVAVPLAGPLFLWVQWRLLRALLGGIPS